MSRKGTTWRLGDSKHQAASSKHIGSLLLGWEDLRPLPFQEMAAHWVRFLALQPELQGWRQGCWRPGLLMTQQPAQLQAPAHSESGISTLYSPWHLAWNLERKIVPQEDVHLMRCRLRVRHLDRLRCGRRRLWLLLNRFWSGLRLGHLLGCWSGGFLRSRRRRGILNQTFVLLAPPTPFPSRMTPGLVSIAGIALCQWRWVLAAPPWWRQQQGPVLQLPPVPQALPAVLLRAVRLPTAAPWEAEQGPEIAAAMSPLPVPAPAAALATWHWWLPSSEPERIHDANGGAVHPSSRPSGFSRNT